MTDPSAISREAAAAAAEVLDQAPAPTSSCCQIGTDAFAESQAALTAEYDFALAELAVAEATLAAEFAAAEDGWIAVEQQLTVGGADAWIVNRVLTQFQAAEQAWQASIDTLSAEYATAETTLQGAESFLAAEAAWFSASACEQTESEQSEAETAETAETAEA